MRFKEELGYLVRSAGLLPIGFSTVLLLNGCALSCWERIKDSSAVYDIDLDHGVCGENKVISFNPYRTQWVKDWPLSHCNGYFAVSPQTQQKLKACAEESARECSK